MAFRRTISQSELRERLSPERREQQATDYSSSRGGWVRRDPEPARDADRDSSGGRLWGRR
ncbi:hypothetical protein AB0F11_33340 [Streptomyces sp. NPDC032472]|uniref:hypothetical protein n=1 Tax=Streptomyces sp. NPDC032472 TaxID=3155018 RepID=UPI0033D1AA11